MNPSRTQSSRVHPSERLYAGETALRLDCDHASDTLVMSFAVFPAPDGKPRFDFVRATSALNAKRIYVRDVHERWYQKGTALLGGSVPEVAASLRNIVDGQHVSRVIAIGNSGGGFAAILFGVMLGVDEIHAFNPPTRLMVPHDTTFPEQLLALQEEFPPGKPFMDLRVVLEEHLKPNTRITIHYSKGDKNDRRHALYLSSFPNVRVFQYPIIVHHLAKFCSSRGLLTPLLATVVDGDEAHFARLVETIKKKAAVTYIPSRVLWFFEKIWGRAVRYAHQIFVVFMGSELFGIF